MNLSSGANQTIEKPLWFGPDARVLAGWLTRPTTEHIRGGVVCASPIGREARAGRRAIRQIAVTLAEAGFATLRFDFDGTGDSSGEFNDAERDSYWVNSVVEATNLLRSLGAASVSAVGMRLGATLLGVAADRCAVGFTSLVLWDPCESGRSYLRELTALEALRREDFEIVAGGPLETSEYVFMPRAVEEIRHLDLSATKSESLAPRTLVMARDDRAVSERLRTNLNRAHVEWMTTSEQAALLDVDPLLAELPDLTVERISKWLLESPVTETRFNAPRLMDRAVVSRSPGFEVNEHFVELGAQRLFGIVSEPTGDVRGPLIVMFNVANEEHIGPARLWVELSRRWSSLGLRCVRFDLRGLGDSPWTLGQPNPPDYFHAWLDDITDVAHELSPDDPSNVVLVGLCSGAFWAIEAGLALGAQGVCALNPPVSTDFLHALGRLQRSSRSWVRGLGARLEPLGMRRWDAAALWHVSRAVLPKWYAASTLERLNDDGVDLFLTYTTDDISPFQRVPFLRSMDVRRLSDTNFRHIEFLPRVDHALHSADGRVRAIDLLDRHILQRFSGVTMEEGFSPKSEDGP